MAGGTADDDCLAGNRRVSRQREVVGDPGEGEHPGENPEASEHINALFGEGSQFHRTHGFYIDGVDENTATLPADWQTRAITRPVTVGDRLVTAIAPCPEDIIVSKLARLDEKDKEFILAFHAVRPLDPDVIERRIRSSRMELAVADRAVAYIRALAAA